ncbi:MAG: diguanylate cyclase (GGDEF)-like protein [Psychromonas sp.]|jgi:diguanylate cyclase (GGDEF)-like protein|uniref:putative bifunctional diguanylate cyclase/phosphodiesterase n=1 Tax=Psychromonas sp. TaxID=1884585 RepID=UPI0039E3BC84
MTEFLIVAGVIFLLASLKPTLFICRQDNSVGWRILMALIILFSFGYLLVLSFLYHSPTVTFVEKSLSIILFGGAIFVLMVVRLSVKSLKKMQYSSHQEKYNALHDSLTGLANRQHFLAVVNKKSELAKPFSVFVLDINGFKKINDMLGHSSADQVLIKTAAVIKRKLPEGCFIARAGGDQFMLISDAVTDNDINKLMDSIHSTLQDPFCINSYNLKISLSIGGALFSQNCTDVPLLLQHADAAVSAAKKKQLKYIIYNKNLENDAQSYLEILSKLHCALEKKKFEVHYQPLINVKKTHVYHFEALIRWPMAEGGFIPPDKFIPIAEQNHLSKWITLFVLNAICTHFQVLKKAGIEACIHLNLSALDLQDDYLSIELDELIKHSRILPQQLVLEVTETAAINDLATTKAVLQRLSLQGFLISLDDFGTGFSSLSMLLELPINQIKIDRSFVILMQQEQNKHSIVKSLIFLAHQLNCTVVAEGVETKELADELIYLKCDYLQGYYYSKALPIGSLISYCQQQTVNKCAAILN